MDVGLPVPRPAAGFLIAGHGVRKVGFGLGGHGLAGGTEEFRHDGFHDGFRGGRPTAPTAPTAVGSRIDAGPFLAAGLLTPAAAMAAMGVMTVVGIVKRPNGLRARNDGYEYPLVLVVVAGALALTGPGRWSADHALALAPGRGFPGREFSDWEFPGRKGKEPVCANC
ncbi:DoxX family protein [Streptomyces sp. NPDC006435]|uniref:DoxX family protein n=1 Tax=Streptomyces sp. NPDC006435 TaxID=3154300 RepID=UPI0033A1FA8B